MRSGGGAPRGGSQAVQVERRDPFRRVVVRLVAVAALLLLVAQGVISIFAASEFEEALLPEIERKAELAGSIASEQIGYALSLGIPVDAIVGMDEFLRDWLTRNPDFAYLYLADISGTVLYGEGLEEANAESVIDLGVPVLVDEQVVARFHIGVQQGSVRGSLLELRYDILTVLIVSLVIAVELLAVFVLVRVSDPMRLSERILSRAAFGDFTECIGLRGRTEVGRIAEEFNGLVRRVNASYQGLVEESEDARAVQLDRRVQDRIAEILARVRNRFRFAEPFKEVIVRPRSPMDVRLPFFAFMLSQELSRPFLPLYFDRIFVPIESLSREVAIGLPITAFMLVVLLVTPVAGALTDRFSSRTLFAVGVVPSVAGHVGTAFATGLVEALAWWMVSGAGYGVIFISAQAYVARHADPTSRALGMSAFAAAVYAAFVCGPAIGGILAERLGHETTLLVAGGLAGTSAIVAYFAFERDPRSNMRISGFSPLVWLRLLSNRRFFAITVLSALPAKLTLAGGFFYLVPIYLTDLGETQSLVGRVMMAYGVACLLVTPLAARGADRSGRHRHFVALGGMVAGLGCLLPSAFDHTYLVLGAVMLLGIGHALQTATQLALIQEVAEESSARMGIGAGAIVGGFRAIERVGTAVGAVLVGALVASFGYGVGIAIIGGLVLVATGLFVVFEWRFGRATEAAA